MARGSLFSTPLNQIQSATAGVLQRAGSRAPEKGEAERARERERKKGNKRGSLCGRMFKLLSCPQWFNSRWQYYVPIHLLSIMLLPCLSLSLRLTLSPAISGYQMPHVALSALVIDSHVRWQIDHYSGLEFSNCGSGPPPHHHHYSFWPIDLPGRGASGLGVPTKDSFFFFSTSDTPPLCQCPCHQPVASCQGRGRLD